MVATDHANLVVIDGAGDLVPRLKRKTAVTRLLGEQLAYLDLDGPSLGGGFNPLAAAPGESEAALVGRWQRWFAGMNVYPQGLRLLDQARRDGVEDVPGLRRWLRQQERHRPPAAVASLGLALSRLTAQRRLREWLEWPANRLAVLPAGALFLACRGTDWARRQLLRAVLLAVLPVAGVRLVVHSFPWQPDAWDEVDGPQQVLVSNGPRLPGSTVVLTDSQPAQTAILSERFLAGDGRWAENLALLGKGESLVVTERGITYATWLDLGQRRRSAG
jgi:hypothetical protein